MHLNPEQEIAVHHVEGPMLVLAGAGSGKTRVITFRIANLLQLGVPASEILAVTFTNKAAEEMRQRVHKIAHAHVLTCTFHSLCARILRESIHHLGYIKDFTIYDEDDSEKLVKECISSLGYKDEKGTAKAIRAQISSAKNSLISPQNNVQDQITRSVYQLYQKKLKEYQALDFDDLLFLTVNLFKEFPDVLDMYQKRWSFILIDEYQDTNVTQDLLIKLLSARHHNVFAVGDPDQSIYSWRGATIGNILNFEHDYPGAKIVPLEQNYRSRSTILEAANALISHNQDRKKKDLWSNLGPGEKIGLYICENEHAEANFVIERILKHHRLENIPLKECVIFYRTNFQSRVFEDALLRERIPYVIIGGLSFYQRREIKDLLSLLRLVTSGSDYLAFSRTINLPKRGIGEATLEKLRDLSEGLGLDITTTCTQILEGKLSFKLSQKQADGLKEYISILQNLCNMLENNAPLHTILSAAAERHFDYLKEDPQTYQERRGNLEELISKAAEWEEQVEFPSLSAFLEELSLKSALDDKDPNQDTVRLMTLHHGKGLEFTVVFLVGMEEDLFPHMHTKDNPDTLQEERRLCYVGMTRAKEHLYLSAARHRFLWGTSRFMKPSRFLSELPPALMQAHHPVARALVEEQPTTDPSAFVVGDPVLHRDFGPGIIHKTYNTSLGLTYDVFFPKANSIRSLVAKYAKLTALDTNQSI
jgi:DNA helicase-2/ATP-dependent DNA helicase PcrA